MPPPPPPYAAIYPPQGDYPHCSNEPALQGVGYPHLSASIPRSVQDNTLDPRYFVQPSSFFKVGTVFATLWHEPAGNENTNASTASQQTFFSTGMLNQRIFSNIRRMVVFKDRGKRSLCHPVSTYGGRGVSKPGVDPALHAPIFIGNNPLPTRVREPRMTKRPLEVQPFTPSERLDPMSRLDFGRVHTVEHYCQVRPIGRIAPESMPFFEGYVSQTANS